MVRTIDDVKRQAVMTYLGLPVPVDFGTPENNYEDADEVGAIISKVFPEALEKCYRMYPWSFARKDGFIMGTRDYSQNARFNHFATISQFLTNPQDQTATITQTVGTSLSNLSVDVNVLAQQIGSEQDQTITLTYDGADWLVDGNVVNVSDYGIYYTGTPVQDDVLTVEYTAYKNPCDYICMQAVFYDAKHWAKCFDWKQYGTDTIKFMPQRLFVEYTADTPVSDWPAYFNDYVAAAVALEACAPLRLESKLAFLMEAVNGVFLDARKQDSMNEPAPASFDNIIDEARNIL